MKKFFALFTALTTSVFLFCFSSCSAGSLYSEGNGNLNVVCSVFPAFDFARNVGGERVTVTLLQDNGSDLHSYTPTAAALKAISEADVFICVGGQSDSGWVDDTLDAAGNPELKVIKLTEYAGDLLFPEKSCDWSVQEHDDHDDHDSHEHTYDEHVWLSLRNAASAVKAIGEAFSDADPDGASEYSASVSRYCEKLEQLDSEYASVFSDASANTLVFADRFPFVYLLHDYLFPYLAAFSGCSTETDASYETLALLTETVKSNSLPAVLRIEGSDGKLAETVSSSTGCAVLTVSSMQSVTRKEISERITYIGVMEANLSVFRQALSVQSAG